MGEFIYPQTRNHADEPEWTSIINIATAHRSMRFSFPLSLCIFLSFNIFSQVQMEDAFFLFPFRWSLEFLSDFIFPSLHSIVINYVHWLIVEKNKISKRKKNVLKVQWSPITYADDNTGNFSSFSTQRSSSQLSPSLSLSLFSLRFVCIVFVLERIISTVFLFP